MNQTHAQDIGTQSSQGISSTTLIHNLDTLQCASNVQSYFPYSQEYSPLESWLHICRHWLCYKTQIPRCTSHDQVFELTENHPVIYNERKEPWPK